MSEYSDIQLLEAISKALDVPDSSYEVAEARYYDLGKWLHDKSKSKCAVYGPEVFPQGSFRLGTAIKPWKSDEYDLDLVCNLKNGVSSISHTQEELKILLGKDLEKYRLERKIKDALEEKHRCWRLSYQDVLKFHVDTVPSIPQNDMTRLSIQERIIKTGVLGTTARTISNLAIAITDDRHPAYSERSPDWYISNPQGYAKWFEMRMSQAEQLLKSRILVEKIASINDLPAYKWKSPLQRAVQILKRHRDIMFEKNPDSKPISIIITTLAAKAYTGENDVFSALQSILPKMRSLISTMSPRIPNPVNPVEDFADKWGKQEYTHLRLEENFYLWLTQVQSDVDMTIFGGNKRANINEHAQNKFGVSIDEKLLAEMDDGKNVYPSKIHQISVTTKPWLKI